MPAVEGRRRWRCVREGGEVWGVYERGKSARRALSRVLWGKGERGSGDWANRPSMVGEAPAAAAAVSTRNQGKGVTDGEG
jgi:hypothetical protein